MMAVPVPPLATPTITARAVATNSALPRPQPARNPTNCSTLPERPDNDANSTMMARPISSVFLPPILDDTKPLINMAMAVTRK
ncbi:hypothetical protein D3C85_1642980 [compost metagenome]